MNKQGGSRPLVCRLAIKYFPGHCLKTNISRPDPSISFPAFQSMYLRVEATGNHQKDG
jgi:hypothetical protein